MGKVISLLRGAERADSALRSSVIASFEQVPGVNRVTVNTVIPFFDGEATSPAYDLIVESWGDDRALSEFAAWMVRNAALAHSYRIEELVEAGSVTTRPGNNPGVKVFAAVTALPGATREATRRHWDAHVPLALQIHVGMDTYVRNWVIGRSHGAPDLFGFSMLHFPTCEDASLRYYAAPVDASRRRIRDDVAKFVASFVKLATAEYVPTPRASRDTTSTPK